MPLDSSSDPLRTLAESPPIASNALESTATYQPARDTKPAAKRHSSGDWPALDGYVIESETAKGEMGRVFAGRDLTLDREVAVKTLLHGANVERFVTESKITARLPHPGIPPVHAMGNLPDGSHYLVMKLIRGRTLAAMLQERTSSSQGLSRLVQVFEQIAQAVGFAHSQAIIHRDLKPLNVMVGAFGEVQVMDWGLAKQVGSGCRPEPELPTDTAPATGFPQVGSGCRPEPELPTDTAPATGFPPHQDDVESCGSAGPGRQPGPTELTAIGAILGTPGYMAPEQARGEIADARADVFALGGILTAILTGKPAFTGTTARETITKAAAADLSDAFSRLEACGADAELVALAKRCLAAKADDRPQNAQVVAEEVAAYRAGVETRLHEVETQRAAAIVRESEQLKRRKQFRVASGIVAAVLIVGIVGTSIGLIQANAAKRSETLRAEKERLANVEAQQQKTLAQAAAEKEKTARLHEERERRYAQAIASFVLDDFLALTSVEGQDRFADERIDELTKDTSLRELLDRAAERLDQRKDLDPRLEADLRWMIGTNYQGFGEYETAVRWLERCVHLRRQVLGSDHQQTLDAVNSLAVSYLDGGNLPEAIPLFEQVRDLRVLKLGPDHTATLRTQTNLALALRLAGNLPEAIMLYEQVRDAQAKKLESDHPDFLTTLNGLAGAYRSDGKVGEAIALFEQVHIARVRKLGANHPNTLTTLGNLARAYTDAKKLPEAIALYELLRDATVTKFESNHPIVLRTLSGLAGAYWTAGRLPEAIALFEQARDASERKLGADHPSTLNTLANLALAYRSSGRIPEAIALFERVHNAYATKLGADHPSTLTALDNQAGAYCAAGRVSEAIILMEQVREAHVSKLGADHPSTLTTLHNLAKVYQSAGRLPEAIAMFEQVRNAFVTKLGADHPDTLITLNSLAAAYQASGKVTEAITLYHQVRDARATKLGANHPDTLTTLNDLALAYRSAKALPEAIAMFEQVLAASVKTLGADHPDTLTTVNNLALAYQGAERLPEAIALYEQAATEIAKRNFAHEHTTRIIPNTIAAYQAAKQLDKAVAWRRKWLDFLRQKAGADHPTYAAALAAQGLNLLELKHWKEAENAIRECLALLETSVPDAWMTFNTRSLLGAALLAQMNYGEAESLLLNAYDGMKSREGMIPASVSKKRLTDVADQLIKLYTSLDKPDEVKKWQAERAKYAETKASEPAVKN